MDRDGRDRVTNASHALVRLTPCRALFKVCMIIPRFQTWKLRSRGIDKLADPVVGLSDPGVHVQRE